MGYTHYWTQERSYTASEWATIAARVQAILGTAAAEGIDLAGWAGEGHPVVSSTEISFNGRERDSHETFLVERERSEDGWSFCKKARKPYDTAVTACLIYLACIPPAPLKATSDGEAGDWEAGLQLARKALPDVAHLLTIPSTI